MLFFSDTDRKSFQKVVSFIKMVATAIISCDDDQNILLITLQVKLMPIKLFTTELLHATAVLCNFPEVKNLEFYH